MAVDQRAGANSPCSGYQQRYKGAGGSVPGRCHGSSGRRAGYSRLETVVVVGKYLKYPLIYPTIVFVMRPCVPEMYPK